MSSGNAIQDGLNSGGYLKFWLNGWAKVTVSRTIMPKLELEFFCNNLDKSLKKFKQCIVIIKF